MKNILLGLLLLPSFIFSQTITGSFTYEGAVRDYRLHLPPGFSSNENLPLVLNLHGYTSNATEQELYSEMNAVADTARFLVCYANGLNEQWNTFANSGTDDVGFLSALIDSLHNQYHVDLNRVYSCGMSNGGFMSYKLACELGERIAAIASVTGSMTTAMLDECSPTRPIPVMQIHGTADPVVAYAGGAFSAGIETVVNSWVQENGCNASPDTLAFPDIVTTDQSTGQKITWSGCEEGTEVVFIKIENGGHTWPGAFHLGIYGPTNQDFEASVEIWNFFNRFELEVVSDASQNVEGQNVAAVFPNPFSEDLTMKINAPGVGTAAVFNVLGERVWQGTLAGDEGLSLSTAAWQPGIYLLKMQIEGKSFFQKLLRQ